MVRLSGIPSATVSNALASLSNDDLRAMMKSLSVPTPRPTRKADMTAAIESRLAGESLRRLWNGLDRTQQCAAPRDLQSVLRLIDRGRVAVSAKTRRASATAVQRIVEVLDGGDFFDPTEKKERWEQTIGPIRAFAWPWLLQAGKLAECRGSKLALTKAGHAALGAAAPALRRLWQRWIKSTLLERMQTSYDIAQARKRGGDIHIVPFEEQVA